jgi:Uma2 family endonuclease
MVRKADVSFIRLDRQTAAQAIEEGHCPIAPDLAVEVLSPNDLAYEVALKVSEYLRAGVRLVWVVHPEVRTVEVHRPQGAGVILHEQDELSSEDVLPGFRCRVADLFVMPTQSQPATA